MPYDGAPQKNIGLTIASRMLAAFRDGERWTRGWCSDEGDERKTCLVGMLGEVLHGNVYHFQGRDEVEHDDARAMSLLYHATVPSDRYGYAASFSQLQRLTPGHPQRMIISYNDRAPFATVLVGEAFQRVDVGWTESIRPALERMHAAELKLMETADAV